MDITIRIFASISLIIGAVECFAGFKAMKVMLAIWGFFAGALIGTIGGVLAGEFIVGAILVPIFAITLSYLSFKLYLAGVFLHTMCLTSVAIYLMFNNIWVALLLGIIVGVAAIYFVKPMVIFSTSFSGAGILVSSAYLMLGLFKFNTEHEFGANIIVAIILWFLIFVAGIFCQFITTQNINSINLDGNKGVIDKQGGKKIKIQRAYRNFCINCGRELFGQTIKCPRCGFNNEE